MRGTRRYRVELTVGDKGELAYECDCPVGDDGIFCKHAVSVALSWLENSGEEVFHAEQATQEKPRKKRKDLCRSDPRVRLDAGQRRASGSVAGSCRA
ncbi:SWIM zinc finger family protein [Cupriavidus basilensis]